MTTAGRPASGWVRNGGIMNSTCPAASWNNDTENPNAAFRAPRACRLSLKPRIRPLRISWGARSNPAPEMMLEVWWFGRRLKQSMGQIAMKMGDFQGKTEAEDNRFVYFKDTICTRNM